MKLAGKHGPQIDGVDEFVADGFKYFELYLTTDIIDELGVEQIIENCEQSKGTFVNVHVPHTYGDENPTQHYFQLTDQIATALDATLILDSNPTSTRYLPDIYSDEDISADSYGYENDPSVSAYYLKNFHLANGYPLILDTAHLHMSEADTIQSIEEILATHTSEQIPSIHLADGTITSDGCAFGDGTLDIPAIVQLLEAYDYNGVVVLETPLEAQEDALKLVRELRD